MSRRTAEANKAVREAWENEQKLVREGTGTRDWTLEQQKDILECGKAHDENGKAFEGHHMQSVEKHPESQGDSGNIQFLTKQEHYAAHGGCWQNPTNWYYDPITKEIIDFGDGKYVPCKVIALSEPLSIAKGAHFTTSGSTSKYENENLSEIEADCYLETVKNESAVIHNAIPNKTSVRVSPKPHSNISVGMWNVVKHTAKSAGKAVVTYCSENPGIVLGVLSGLGGIIFDAAFSSQSTTKTSTATDTSPNENFCANSYGNEDDTLSSNEAAESDTESIERSSPREHGVSGYDRQQHGKTVHVRPHKRGRKNGKDE